MCNNQGIMHAARRKGGEPLCKNRNAHMSTDIETFQAGGLRKCKRCEAKLAKSAAERARRAIKAAEAPEAAVEGFVPARRGDFAVAIKNDHGHRLAEHFEGICPAKAGFVIITVGTVVRVSRGGLIERLKPAHYENNLVLRDWDRVLVIQRARLAEPEAFLAAAEAIQRGNGFRNIEEVQALAFKHGMRSAKVGK